MYNNNNWLGRSNSYLIAHEEMPRSCELDIDSDALRMISLFDLHSVVMDGVSNSMDPSDEAIEVFVLMRQTVCTCIKQWSLLKEVNATNESAYLYNCVYEYS